MLINTLKKTNTNLNKPVNFDFMMRRQLNEVTFYNGNLIRKQIKILDSHRFIILPLNLSYVQFTEKVILLFHRKESQHLISKMLAFFFYPTLKEKQL